MKLRLTSLMLAVAILGGLFTMSATRTAAQNPHRNQTLIGLVNALVNVNVTDTQIGLVNVDRSLNNLRALNNFLNNNDIDITVQDIDVLRNANILNGLQLSLLNNALQNAQTAVGVAVLSSGDLILFQRR